MNKYNFIDFESAIASPIIDNHYSSHFKSKTDCIETVSNLIECFCTEEKEINEKVENNKEGFTQSKVLKELLNQSESKSKAKHAFFSFFHFVLGHKYLIEKVWDGKEFFYKLHHSWVDEFTLSEWEGLDPLPVSKPGNQCPQFFQSYRGKILTANEIEKFLNEIIAECERRKKETIFTMIGLKLDEIHVKDLDGIEKTVVKSVLNSYLTFHSIDTNKLNKLNQLKKKGATDYLKGCSENKVESDQRSDNPVKQVNPGKEEKTTSVYLKQMNQPHINKTDNTVIKMAQPVDLKKIASELYKMKTIDQIKQARKSFLEEYDAQNKMYYSQFFRVIIFKKTTEIKAIDALEKFRSNLQQLKTIDEIEDAVATFKKSDSFQNYTKNEFTNAYARESYNKAVDVLANSAKLSKPTSLLYRLIGRRKQTKTEAIPKHMSIDSIVNP